MNNKTVIVANITWNPTGWRNSYINPHAGHSYARMYPGHESLNFKFDKKDLDTNRLIYGFVQWTNPPVKFEDGGIILFYTKNLDMNRGEIVGIYCNTKIIETIQTPWNSFENDKLLSNIEAQKDLSMLFPISLATDKYSKSRLVPQVGYTYKDINFAEQMILDEVDELSKSGMQFQEFDKLKRIYEYVTGKEYILDDKRKTDLTEQDELDSFFSKNRNKAEIIAELKKLKETDPELIEVNNKTYSR